MCIFPFVHIVVCSWLIRLIRRDNDSIAAMISFVVDINVMFAIFALVNVPEDIAEEEAFETKLFVTFLFMQ